MDWQALQLEHPERLAWAGAAALACLALFPLGRRHSRGTRLAALALRIAAVAAVGVLMASPVFIERQEFTPQREGIWRLEVTAERAPVDAFVDRVRAALAAGGGPGECEIAGGELAEYARLALAELGVAGRIVGAQDAATGGAMLAAFDAPAVLQPGEAVEVTARLRGAGSVQLMLNGEPAATEATGDGIRYTGPALRPGAHVFEARLLDPQGAEVHRAGRVVRVGPPPRLLRVGMDQARGAEIARLAPDHEHLDCAAADLNESRLAQCALVVAPLDALYALTSQQAFELRSFVARGGGLYVTGDGAKHVAPDYLHDDIRALLPVRVLAQPRPDKPEDPPLEEIPGRAEIAKVSVCFVLDRSTSMDQLIGNSGVTRWQVAVRGVAESLEKLSIDARAGVMAFTLKQNWLARPRVFLKFNREEMARTLRVLEGDNEYDDAGFNTDIYAAVKSALDVIEPEPSAVKMIILLTDGGDRPANAVAGLRHADLRARAAAKGINIVAIGIGSEFAGADTGGEAARRVINELATRPDLAFMPASDEAAAQAHAIFISSVETAFMAFDQKKKQEEEERRRRLEEQQKQQEPPAVEALPGEFPLVLADFGRAQFGPDALPQPAPKLAWFARNMPRADAAVALAIEAPGAPAALAFGASGLGRVAFWAAGTRDESLGELTGWADFPGLFAASLRWLTPREMPDLRLVGGATPGRIRLLDPVPGATYHAHAVGAGAARELRLEDATLIADPPLPRGAWEIIEQLGDSTRRVGDVWVSEVAAGETRAQAQPAPPRMPPAPARAATVARPAAELILYLTLLLLIVLPVERWSRRRT